MKASRLMLLLALAAVPVVAMSPPYHSADEAANANDAEIFQRSSTHRHDNDGSSRLWDVIPDADSTYDLGKSGVEWSRIYVDTGTFNNVAISSNATVGGSLTVSGGSSFSGQINMNSQKIVSVANGTVSTDAVAFGQLAANVVQTVKSDSFSSGSSGAWTDVSGTTVTITPSASSSKVKVTFVVNGEVSSGNAFLRIVRGATPTVVAQADAAGNRIVAHSTLMRSDSANQDLATFNSTMVYLDSPATTSSVSYRLQYYLTGGTLVINRGFTDTDSTSNQRTISTFLVEEVRQ